VEPRVLRYDLKRQGEPIVLVPGGLTGWQSWIPHQERLADRYRVIRVQPIHNELGQPVFPETRATRQRSSEAGQLLHRALRMVELLALPDSSLCGGDVSKKSRSSLRQLRDSRLREVEPIELREPEARRTPECIRLVVSKNVPRDIDSECDAVAVRSRGLEDREHDVHDFAADTRERVRAQPRK
jgi:hypothetical protein